MLSKFLGFKNNLIEFFSVDECAKNKKFIDQLELKLRPFSQSSLIKQSKKLLFPVPLGDDGVCFGVKLMLVEAKLRNPNTNISDLVNSFKSNKGYF